MAEKINIEVALKSAIQQSKTDIENLKGKKVFEGSAGEKQLTKLNGIIDRLSKVDLSNLKGPELTKFLKDLTNLRDLIDSSARSLTTYTKEFEEQQKVLTEATKVLNSKKGTRSEKLQLKKDALKKVDLSTQTYFNTATGKQVTNIDTIIKLLKENVLEIRSKTGKTPVKPENYNSILEKTGIQGYKEASEQYEIAKQEVNAQQVVVNSEKSKLDGMPKVGDVHPLTSQVQQNSADTADVVSQIRDQDDNTTKEEIDNTTNAINKQIPTIEKQQSSLGRAFKQFTLYAVAVRAAKTAIREAVQTVKELDKYLTEQAMVTGLTREQTYGLVKSYQELALQCGATTKEIAEVSTEYMKQGKSIKESLTLTQAAVSAAKVARVSVGDSVNYLTTALNGFRLSAEDAMLVSDKFAAVAAASATDYDELAIALSKVASQANLAGMSIDYTTALLTKGLETTREAPETMGTALKTIIARMRELGDYGETLEGDVDINNVESQLAYVDIALRNANGELRSTEEVLDELGKKWDTLDKNQQAAIAKALAGTRQQSRLIAMMDDYERVTELQEIAARSAGATAAQAGVYLEGIEASINKIQVAWEKIVMSLTDSEVIIDIIGFIGDSLDTIGDFLSTDWGLVSTLTIVATLGVQILGNKMKEIGVAKALATEARLKEIRDKKAALLEKKATIAAKEQVLLAKKEGKQEKFNLNIEKIRTKLKEGEISDEQAQLLMQQAETDLKKDEATIQTEIDNLKSEEMALEQELYTLGAKGYGNWTGIASTVATVGGGIGTLITGSTTWLGIMTAISLLFKAIPPVMALINVATKKQNMEELKGIPLLIAKMYAKAASTLGPIAGPIAATAILAGIAALAGIGIAASMGAFKQEEDKSTAAEVNELSTEIYKLQEKANAINEITTSFNNLDDKLIKTNEDLKEMNSLLEKAADSLSDEEKEVYNSLQTEEEKIRYLENLERETRQEIYSKNDQIINKIAGMSSSGKTAFFNEDTTDAEVIQAQSAIRAVNNTQLYKQIDLMKESNELNEEEAAAVEAVTQALFSEMSAEENWQYAQDKTGQSIERLIKKIKEQQIVLEDGSKISAATILNSEDYTLKEQVQAFKEIEKSLQGDTVALQAFRDSYQHLVTFTTMNPIVLDFIEDKGLTNDQINNMYSAWKALQKEGIDISQEVFESRFSRYMEVLAETNGDVLTATKEVFYDYLDGSEKTLNAFINAYGNIVEKGLLNMGQSLEKTKNTINSFYEKAMEWNELSDSEKSEFISDNLDLFSGDSGAELLTAFENGDYEKIEEALRNNETLQKKLQQQRDEIAQELKIEEAKQGDERNEAYIKQLKQYQSYLNNVEDLFKASLEVRLDQEQKQLDEYRSYLEDQREALEESLEKRKEAYEKYFSEVDQQQEDLDYQEQSDLLISNLTKLGASQDANSQKQAKEIEQQLKELEEERLQQLRERAREALLENMEDEISQINDKFDELLENNKELLKAMTQDLENPLQFVSDLIANKVESGATSLEVESYIKSLEGTFGSVLGDKIDWDNISVREENNQMILNVNGQEIKLDAANEQNLYQIIMQALTEIGAR